MFGLSEWPKFQWIAVLQNSNLTWVSILLLETISFSALIRYYLHLKEDNRKLRDSLGREIRLREEERSGRIALQQKARIATIQKINESGFSFQPIGIIETPFPNRCGTPVQSKTSLYLTYFH